MNLKVCKNCPTKPVKAKGLCGACYSRQSYWRNPEEVLAQQRAWKAQHPDRVKEIHKRSWMKNKGRYKSAMKEWRQKNSTQERERRLQYYQAHRDAEILEARNWNFKKRYGLTVAQRDELIAQQNNCCAACGEKFEGVRGKLAPFVHHDHKLNAPNYIAILHSRCNIAMGQLGDDPILLAKLANFANNVALKVAG